jgi:Domain of unknown function (DUF4303)
MGEDIPEGYQPISGRFLVLSVGDRENWLKSGVIRAKGHVVTRLFKSRNSFGDGDNGMSIVEFGAVRREMVDAARRAFSGLRREHPEERFYAFALCSDQEAEGICPSANSEEGLLRRQERMGYRREEDGFVSKKRGVLDDAGWNYYRWNLPEWSFHSQGIKEFRRLDPLIEHASQAEEDDPGAFLAYRAQLYGTMILALRDLDVEGFFGKGMDRKAVTLFCDLVEPPDKYWFAPESAKLLNPASNFEEFSKQWMAWIGNEGREIVGSPASHSPIHGPLTEFVAGCPELGR